MKECFPFNKLILLRSSFLLWKAHVKRVNKNKQC